MVIEIGKHFDLLPPLCKGMKIVLIADIALKKLYAEKLAQHLNALLIYIPSGEKAKTREIKQQIEDQLFKAGCGRDTVILAMGGGATTDVVGFVAATYLRGVPLILIPTTLLAMVDAAIGGKTGINTEFGKNMLGSIYFPKTIVFDYEFLDSLPEVERMNGMSEILKMGLIANPELLKGVDIERAAKTKMAIVEQDPYEKGLRRILNFGHTVAHALERLSNYTIPHGQAVAIGCVVESYLSLSLGYLSRKDFDQIETFFPIYRLPASYKRKAFLQAMTADKKNKGGQVRFVLIDQIGRAMPFDGEYCRPVSDKELEGTLSYMEKRYG